LHSNRLTLARLFWFLGILAMILGDTGMVLGIIFDDNLDAIFGPAIASILIGSASCMALWALCYLLSGNFSKPPPKATGSGAKVGGSPDR
jgi:hypothetical protein